MEGPPIYALQMVSENTQHFR